MQNLKEQKVVNSRKNPKYFREMVSYVDKIVGKIVAKLEEQKLSEKTMIVFTGDNGTAVR